MKSFVGRRGAMLGATGFIAQVLLSGCLDSSRSYSQVGPDDGGAGESDASLSTRSAPPVRSESFTVTRDMPTRAPDANPQTREASLDASAGSIDSTSDGGRTVTDASIVTNNPDLTLHSDALDGGEAGSTSAADADAASEPLGPTVGSACSQQASLACDVSNPAQVLYCSAKQWVANGLCRDEENCNPDTGRCKAIVPDCAGAMNGGLRCTSSDELVLCGRNAVSVVPVETCAGRCITTDGVAACQEPRCGDGKLQGAEECDDGNADNTDACTQLCTSPYCGDGFTNNGEQCDDGNSDNNDGCTENCATPYCGDGFTNNGEECDDGNSDNTDACTQLCASPDCGDGFVNEGEPCDDGNLDNTDTCTQLCTPPYCGDGYTNNSEECDDRNSDNTDSCMQNCVWAYCGDGITNNGEECDDGDPNSDVWDLCMGCLANPYYGFMPGDSP